MKTKRPTPRRLPSGNWTCRVVVDGERISVTDEDKDICQAKAIALQAGIIKQSKKETPVTLDQAIQDYLRSKSEVLSPSTIVGYDAVRKERFKGIMQRNVYSLTKKDIQIAVNQECKYVSPKTVKNAYGVVSPVLKSYGIDVSGVKLPQTVKKNRNYVQMDEIEKLIDVIRGDPCEIQILMALWLGMRRSEIMGLHWDCIDYEHKWLVIKRTLVLNQNNEYVLKDGAKNKSSQRKVNCPDYILDKLREKQGDKVDGPCFTNHPNTILKRIHMACEAAGITDTTTHGLRHTNAAVMRSLGISDAHAMERGGWNDDRTYKATYSYVFESTAEKEDNIVNEFFSQLAQNEKMATKMATKK